MRIFLIRHGPSAHSPPQGLLDRAGVERWRADYDMAGIAPGRPPAPALVGLVASADVVVASDLPRAVASASLLWPARTVDRSSLFREIPLPIPELGGIRAPLAVWSAAIHLQWGFDILTGRDVPPGDRERVAEAATWCERAHAGYGTEPVVAIVTHGVFRRALANRLVTTGWRLTGSRRYAPWSLWTLTRGNSQARSFPGREDAAQISKEGMQ